MLKVVFFGMQAKFFMLSLLVVCMSQAILAYGVEGKDGLSLVREPLKGKISAENRTQSSYKISPGDTISFSINEETEYDQSSIIVRPDGYATIKPIGQVLVAGKDIKELTRYLEDNLTNYVKDPQVFVSVQDFHVPKIYLLGAVVHPGVYQPQRKFQQDGVSYDRGRVTNLKSENGEHTISNVLINSGGLEYDADLKHIVVTRPNGEHRDVDLIALLLNGDVSQDILLEEEDVITVPRVNTPFYDDEVFKTLSSSGIYPERFPVRVMGEVDKPGLFYVASDSPYLNTAIVLASGYRKGALQKAVIIKRRVKHEDMAKIVIDPGKVEFMLRPNDIVEIRDAKSYKVLRGAEEVARLAAPFWWVSMFK